MWDTLRKLAGDSWLYNPFSGMGDPARDKTAPSNNQYVELPRLDDVTLSILYRDNGIARVLCRVPIETMLMNGIETEGDVKPPFDLTLLTNELQEAMCLARAYGGSLLVVGADDGRSADTPLDPSSVRNGVSWFEVVDRRSVQIQAYEDRQTEAGGQHYRKPLIYRVTSEDQSQTDYHRSRVIRFNGAPSDALERRKGQGWDPSILQAMYVALMGFDSAHSGGRNMLAEASIAVFKMKNYLAALASRASTEILERARLINLSKSSTRSVFLDAEREEFTYANRSFAGVAELMDREAQYLSAVSRIPLSVLLGTSPAGLNATGASEIRGWYDLLRSIFTRDVLPVLRRVSQMGGARELPCFVLPSLWQETSQEKEMTRKARAEADVAYIDANVYTPEEISATRGDQDGIKYDKEARNIVITTTDPDAALVETPSGGKEFLVAELEGPFFIIDEIRANRGYGPHPDPEVGKLTPSAYLALLEERKAATLALAVPAAPTAVVTP